MDAELPHANARRALNQVAAFRYVTADNAPTYRAILQVFFEARQRYVIELRAHDVREQLQASSLFYELASEDALDRHLDQLVAWGNLAAAHDPGAVTRLEDFYKRRLLYHLTGVGEAAYRAVTEVEATVGRSGSLQSTMLLKIRDALLALADAGGLDAPAADPLFRLFHDLQSAFDTLTEEANRFIGELDGSATHRAEEEQFVHYKQALLAYISRFVEQLRRLADDIRRAIDAVQSVGAERLIALAAQSPDLPPSLGDGSPAELWSRDQHSRWCGIRTWFQGGADGGTPATVDRLAQVARGAVISLTRSLGRLNERRARPVDRAADFRTLARWFSQCQDDRAAHRLWRAAFGLAPARHFDLEDADKELVPPGTSWWDAPPVEVPVRLRSHGNTTSAGRPSAAPDHSLTRQWIAQKRRRERAQVQEAVRRFAGRGALRISSFVSLDGAEFDLFLSLLEEALAAARRSDGSRTARTSDGRLQVTLRPPESPDGGMVKLVTPSGELHCLDYAIEVVDLLSQELAPHQEGIG